MNSPTTIPATGTPIHHATGTSSSTEYPELRLLKQTSSSQEKVSKNGIQKNVHVVVKNTPFVLDLGLTHSVVLNNQVLDLRQLSVDLHLLYDCDGFKPVNFVKAKPCEYKLSVNERGDQMSLNTRIKVLTSQHEDMLFRIRISLIESKSKQEFDPPLEVLTEPIKVISKPKQTRKRKRAPAVKRTLNDILVETVQRIEEQQKRQQQCLEHVLLGKDPNVSSSSLSTSVTTRTHSNTHTHSSSSENEQTSPNTSMAWETSNSDDQDEFAIAFQRFLMSYNQTLVEDKPSKIRKIMRSCSNREGEQLSELLDLLLAAPTKQEGYSEKKMGVGGEEGTCNCSHCPHRLELAKIDQFYTEFLTTEGAGFQEVMDSFNS